MRRATIAAGLVMFALLALAARGPGWIGLGFTHHTTNDHSGHSRAWLFVQQLAPGGPAHRAGLRPQDVVTAINGKPIAFKDSAEAMQWFGRLRVGEKVALTIVRREGVKNVTIVTAELPAEYRELARQSRERANAEHGSPPQH